LFCWVERCGKRAAEDSTAGVHHGAGPLGICWTGGVRPGTRFFGLQLPPSNTRVPASADILPVRHGVRGRCCRLLAYFLCYYRALLAGRLFLNNGRPALLCGFVSAFGGHKLAACAPSAPQHALRVVLTSGWLADLLLAATLPAAPARVETADPPHVAVLGVLLTMCDSVHASVCFMAASGALPCCGKSSLYRSTPFRTTSCGCLRTGSGCQDERGDLWHTLSSLVRDECGMAEDRTPPHHPAEPSFCALATVPCVEHHRMLCLYVVHHYSRCGRRVWM